MTLWIEDDANDLPPLVLVHGWAMHGGMWGEALLDELRKQWRLLLVDLPGHGHSEFEAGALTPDRVIVQLAGRIPPEACWLGWSLGGLVALQAAASGLASRLIMVASSPCFVARADWPEGVAGEVFDQFADGLASDLPKTLKRFLALEVHGSDDPRGELRELQRRLEARPLANPAALQEGLGLLQESDLRSQLASIEVPTLWLGGDRDRLVRKEALIGAARAMPMAKARILGRAGHAPFLSSPQDFLAAIKRFRIRTGQAREQTV